MTREMLEEHRLIWEEKPVLRAIYTDYYRRITAACVAGRTLEIGGGGGNLKALLPDVISTDIVPNHWLDVVADAMALPFAGGSFANIVMVDVLHHIERPARFLSEAVRVLAPGGRLIMMEPAITAASWPFYHLLHPEPVDMGADPLADGPLDPQRVPFDANQALPTLLTGRHRERLQMAFPELQLITRKHLSLIAYPLSGGFREWSLIPAGLVPPLLALESAVAPLLGWLLGFRLLVVWQRREP